MIDVCPNTFQKGRGAVSNATGRFEEKTVYAVNDGWDLQDDLPPLRTSVMDEHPKTIITKNSSPDVPFDRSINPYRGCEHGCVYCFARPTHAFHGLSSGLDFESKLFAKPDAAKLLEAELQKPGYVVDPIAIGTNTDPYQPIERDRRIMRDVLEVLDAHNHPVSIVTKSALVLRDLDILGPMAARGLASVGLSVTTLDRDLARHMEPRAATPSRRLHAIRELTNAGVKTFCLAAPMIPGLNDHELENIVIAAVDAGAVGAGYVLLRLPLEIKELFTEWLDEHEPGRKSKVLNMMRASRNGALYVTGWGTRQRGTGKYADLLEARMNRLRTQHRLTNADRPAEFKLRTDFFTLPPRAGDQLQLL